MGLRALDRGIASKEREQFFLAAEVRGLEVFTSDNLSLCIYLNRQVYRPKEWKFRFENVWSKESKCRYIIQEC